MPCLNKDLFFIITATELLVALFNDVNFHLKIQVTTHATICDIFLRQ